MRKLWVVMLTVMLAFAFVGIAQADLDDGLVAYYPFNGNANNAVSDYYDGTVKGAVLSNGRDGTPNSAYDCSSGYIDIDDGNPLGSVGSGTFSVSIWVKMTSENYGVFFNLGKHPDVFQIYYYGDPYQPVELRSSMGYQPPLSFQKVVNIDTWYHVVCVVENQELRVYLNGELVGSKAISYDLYSEVWNNWFRFGADVRYETPPALTYFDGAIDDVRIYDRALSGDEIVQLAETTPESCLVAYYPFNGDSNDESGNENHATPYNGVTFAQGVDGQAASFDGVDDHFRVPYNPELITPTWTISAWIYAENLPDSTIPGLPYRDHHRIITTDETVADNHATYSISVKDVDFGSPSYLVANYEPANSETNIGPRAKGIYEDTWYFITYTRDVEGNSNLYIDGELVDTVFSEKVPTLLPQDVVIGKPTNSFYEDCKFDGLIDELRIYNCALSQEGIQELYSNGSDPDGDGILNDDDNCPFIANPDQADNEGDGIGDVCDPDDDNDSVLDSTDNCPFTSNTEQLDNDEDLIGDLCDTDDDNDNVLDDNDNCPFSANPNQNDIDDDGLGDVCDDDPDGDGVLEGDNCPSTPNPLQENNDGDTEGDVCDPDDDNDDVIDEEDNCPLTPNPDQDDLDEDNIGDACDLDVDGDGIEDEIDNCERIANVGQEDTDSDGSGDACDDDDDNDGVLDIDDNCSLMPNPGQSDTDGDGQGDICDGDLDGDGIANDIDNCPSVANGNQNDFDGDGFGDSCDEDIDGDGVLNESDECEFTAFAEVVDADTGCSIDQLCPCEGPRGTTEAWKNHGKYVSCVSHSAKEFVKQDLINETEKGNLVSEAAQSNCGDKK